jgi:hypothetical protein
MSVASFLLTLVFFVNSFFEWFDDAALMIDMLWSDPQPEVCTIFGHLRLCEIKFSYEFFFGWGYSLAGRRTSAVWVSSSGRT